MSTIAKEKANPQAPIIPQWLTVEQAATYTGTSKETIRRLIKAGKLQGTFFTPRALRVSVESLDNLAAANATTRWGGAA